MPVPCNSTNGFSFNHLQSDSQKKTIYGSDPLLFKANNSKTADQNGHVSNGIGYLDTGRRRACSASNATNGAVENGSSMSNGTTHHMNGHASSSSEATASASSSSNSSSCRQICVHLAYDVISAKSKSQDSSSGWLWKYRRNGLSEDNEYSKTMHRTVAEISERHEILFSSMVKKLNITRENYEEVFISVVDDIFRDDKINWGRIVTVYALGGKIAQFFVDNGMDDCLDGLAERVGSYVDDNLGAWIVENGGWNAFVRFFPEEVNSTDDRVWNSGLLMAVTLAGAAGLATLFSLRP